MIIIWRPAVCEQCGSAEPLRTTAEDGHIVLWTLLTGLDLPGAYHGPCYDQRTAAGRAA